MNSASVPLHLYILDIHYCILNCLMCWLAYRRSNVCSGAMCCQADTDCDSAAWIQAIQAGVTKAYNQRQSIDTKVGLMQIFLLY